MSGGVCTWCGSGATGKDHDPPTCYTTGLALRAATPTGAPAPGGPAPAAEVGSRLPRAVEQADGTIVVYVQGPIRGERPELVLSVVGGTDRRAS